MISEKINSKDKRKEDENEDFHLEDILASIRGIIDNRDNVVKSVEKSQNFDKEDDSVLELTNIVSAVNDNSNEEKNDESLISAETKTKAGAEFNKLSDYLDQASNYSKSEESLDSTVNRLMLPLIKNWLDNNLPEIVEKIVAAEIKEIILKRK